MAKDKKKREKVRVDGPLSEEEQAIVTKIMKEQEEKEDSVEVAKYGKFNNQEVLNEMFENFLSAIQQRAVSPISGHVWGEDDTFDEWVTDAEKILMGRLEELKEKFEKRIVIFPKMAKLQDQGILTKAPNYVGRHLTREDYEFYHYTISKTLEVVRLYKNGILDIKGPSYEEIVNKYGELAKKKSLKVFIGDISK